MYNILPASLEAGIQLIEFNPQSEATKTELQRQSDLYAQKISKKISRLPDQNDIYRFHLKGTYWD
jgi:hypothetical protein